MPPPALSQRPLFPATSAAALLTLAGPAIVYAHTFLAMLAFIGALGIVALGGYWKEVCTNAVAGWPVEWFPSVSATIGDTLPARAFFHILIALCAGPRFALVAAQWLSTRRRGSREPDLVAVVGLLRTFTCGGWMFVTSRDMGDFHDAAMIAYLILTLPWMWGTIRVTRPTPEFPQAPGLATCLVNEDKGGTLADAEAPITSPGIRQRRAAARTDELEPSEDIPPSGISESRKSSVAALSRASHRRRVTMALFFGSFGPLVWYYVQHKVHRVKGAYTLYALFEWSLVVYDVTFDSIAGTEARHLQIQIQGDTLAGVRAVSTDAAGDRRNGNHGGKAAPTSAFSYSLFMVGEPIRPSAPVGPHDHLWELPHIEAGWQISQSSVGPLIRGISVVSDTILAYCFWTTFTVLTTQLFYWSVWKLALSGSELALITTLSPYLLSFRNISRFSTSRRGQSILRGLALTGTLTAWALPTPLLRLIWVSAASAATWLELGGRLSHMQSAEAHELGLIMGCGLVCALLAKFANASNNPFWSILDEHSGGWNKTGLVLGLIAWTECHFRPLLVPAAGIKAQDRVQRDDESSPNAESRSGARWLLSLGFGHILFLVHTLATDAGTVIAASWTGYPVRGPELLQHGPVAIASVCSGFAIASIARERWLPSTLWSACALAGAVLYVQFDDWICFAGGCLLIAYVCSLLPIYLQRLSQVEQSYVGTVVGRAMLVYCVWIVAATLTVSYAFVPGGWLFRERMDAVTYTSVIAVAIGIHQRHGFSGRQVGRNEAYSRAPLFGLGLATAAAFGLGAHLRASSAPIVPYHTAESRVWTGGIWAVHFGVDEEGHDSQGRMLELIRDMEVDVIGLLETDLHRPVYGNRDLTRKIAEGSGYYVDIGPGPDKHTWGAAILSKFPIIKSEHHLLPSPRGELAPAIHAVLDIWGQHINVIVSHNGQEEDALDRELQSTALAKIMSEHDPEPFAFLGYLVTTVGAPRPAPYQIIMLEGKMWDVEIEDRKRWCQYIAFRNMWRVAYARVTYSTITDTELQVARWVLPEPGRPVDYRTNEELYHHWWEDKVSEDWRFTQKFRGNGTRGHTYEIFDGPIYYLPPKRFFGIED